MPNLPEVPEVYQLIRYEKAGKQVIHGNMTLHAASFHAKAYQKASDFCNKDYVYDIEVIEYE